MSNSKSAFGKAYKAGETVKVDKGALSASPKPLGEYVKAKVINPSNGAGKVHVHPLGGAPAWVWLAWTRRP